MIGSMTGSILGGESVYGNDFVTEWNITTNGESLTIPCQNVGVFNAEIDWGDGSTSTITTYNDADLVHTYTTAGLYLVRISGQFPNIFINGNTVMKNKLKRILQLGDVGWMTFQDAFDACINLTSVKVSPCNTASVTNFAHMFNGCTGVTVFPYSFVGLDTASAVNVSSMLGGVKASAIPDLSVIDTSSVQDFSLMLIGCGDLTSRGVFGVETIDIGAATTLSNFAIFTTLSTAQYDAILINWEAQAPPSGLAPHFGSSTYTLGGAAEAARTSLINTYGWTITDGGGV